jgi:hypothetical protein
MVELSASTPRSLAFALYPGGPVECRVYEDGRVVCDHLHQVETDAHGVTRVTLDEKHDGFRITFTADWPVLRGERPSPLDDELLGLVRDARQRLAGRLP